MATDTEPVALATGSGVRTRRARSALWFTVTAALFVMGFGLFALRREPQPAIALLMLVAIVVAAAIQPRWGLYAIVFFTLAGDYITATWYPFVRTLSMQESVLFLSNKLSFSPLEIVVAATVTFWIIDTLYRPGARVVRGPLLTVVAVFTGFVAFGFLNGVGSGGDLRIALFEGRAIFTILPVYLLAINLCNRDQLRRLMWVAVAAIMLNSLLALGYLRGLSPADREGLEDLGEHSASVHFAFVLLLTFTLFLYGGATRLTRFAMLAVCVPIVAVFIDAQRRSAMVAFGMGVILIIISLAWNHRAKFFVLAPLLILVTIGYSAAFWNSTSSVGFPAQAVKTVVAPDSATEEDRGSDLYRDIENANLNYTVRSAPLLGLGFGQKFLRPFPLPDISFFALYEYVPHNSVVYIWIKTGFFGFMSLLSMFSLSVAVGAEQVVSARDPTHRTMAMIGVVGIAMFAVYAFVDIAWDARNMVFVGLSLALCSIGSVRPAVEPRLR